MPFWLSTEDVLHVCILYQIFILFLTAAKSDHSDSDCFMCVFLTHGEDGIIYGRDGTVDLQEIFDLFRGENCPTLIGKPKLFLIQVR